MGVFSQPNRVNTFVAAFDSDCHTCGEPIHEGDEAGYLPHEDYPSCEDCIEWYKEGGIDD